MCRDVIKVCCDVTTTTTQRCIHGNDERLLSGDPSEAHVEVNVFRIKRCGGSRIS